MIMNENLGRAMLQRRNDERGRSGTHTQNNNTYTGVERREEAKRGTGRSVFVSKTKCTCFSWVPCQLRKERSRSSNFSQALNSAKHNTIAGLAGVLPLPHKIEPARLCAAVVVFVLSA